MNLVIASVHLFVGIVFVISFVNGQIANLSSEATNTTTDTNCMSIGDLSTLEHGVSGSVYASDSKHFYIQNFSYDGNGVEAFFWIGKTKKPDKDGTRVTYPVGNTMTMREFKGESLELTIPSPLTIHNIAYLAVWCRAAGRSFGHVNFNLKDVRFNKKSSKDTTYDDPNCQGLSGSAIKQNVLEWLVLASSLVILIFWKNPISE